ncbi:MAG: MlaD family protein [Bacteroidales bacterium]|nr:MlaD family protein [Bacteroidales bacterium]
MVQISAMPRDREMSQSQLKGIETVTKIEDGERVKYAAGKFPVYDDAIKYRRTLVLRFPDAFVIAIRNGKTMPLREAIDTKNKSNNSMKISNEVKVGAVAVITIGAFILLFNFLKGTALFTSTDTYHIVYNNIAGLTESSPVEINGFQAGVVQDIRLINDGSGLILVSLSVDRNFNVPKDTEAEITTATLIAGMKVVLRMGESSEMCHNHDTLSGYVATSIIDRLSQTIAPLEGNITDMIIKLDSVVSALNDLFTPEMTSDLRSSVSNVSGITASLRRSQTTKRMS